MDLAVVLVHRGFEHAVMGQDEFDPALAGRQRPHLIQVQLLLQQKVEDVDVIGEVDDADVVLDGIEINNEEVRRRVMLDQIREAVQARPEESASVLRRWTRTES